jgi:hypothetical protein
MNNFDVVLLYLYLVVSVGVFFGTYFVGVRFYKAIKWRCFVLAVVFGLLSPIVLPALIACTGLKNIRGL